MKSVRLGMIGMGAISKLHLGYMDQVRGLELTALCDTDPEALSEADRTVNGARAAAGLPAVKPFARSADLLRSGLCDAVMICTPHYDHPPLAMAAFKRGLHVLTEKPIGVHTQHAKQMIAAHRRTRGLVFAAMFQQRTDPVYRKAREIIGAGVLGDLRLVTWTITTWFRSQSYYDSGGWRATWGGEGGGVLLNQCPHTLDMLTWLVGLPSRVTAQVNHGKYHDIEVEDEVNALLEFPGGAIGHFVTSTAVAPGTNRLEIVGDRATMIVGEKTIEVREVEGGSVQAYNRSTPERFKRPGTIRSVVRFEDAGPGGHRLITQNFADAILRGRPLIAPAEEGLRGLALGNAMMLSGWTRRPVDLPFKDREYKALLEERIRSSTFRKTVRKTGAGENFKESFGA